MRKKILFISARLPFPCAEGHQIRTFGVLKQLSKAYDIHLVSLLRPGEKVVTDNELGELCKSIVGVPVNLSFFANIKAVVRGLIMGKPLVISRYITPELRGAVVQAIAHHKPDVVHMDLLPLAELADVCGNIPMVLNEHNVESELVAQKVEITGNPVFRWVLAREYKLLREFEKVSCKRMNNVLACSDDDVLKLHEMGASRVHCIPNGVDTQKLVPCDGEMDMNSMVFLGGMGWYPNRLGVQWFINEVMPRIVAVNPKATFNIVGNPEPEIEIPRLLSANIIRHGFVDDFRPIVNAAAVMVVPIQLGSGTRLKVVEAAALGKCMVSTFKGAEGVMLDDGDAIILRDNADEFAKAILALQAKPAEVMRIGNSARQIAVARYDWNAIGDKLRRIYAA